MSSDNRVTNSNGRAGSNVAEYRLIGTIVEKVTDKKFIGYIVMNERNGALKAYTPEQMVVMLKNYKFVNAVYDKTRQTNNGIVNTECSLDRLLKFNNKLQILDARKIIILGEIFEGEKSKGYRIYSSSGRVIDITEEDLLKMVHRTNCDIVNGKIVNRDGSVFISAIKTEFTRIKFEAKKKAKSTADTANTTNASNASTASSKEDDKANINRARHERFRVKLVERSVDILRKMLTDSEGLPLSAIHSGYGYIPRTSAEVLVNEILSNVSMPANDREILERIQQNIPKLSTRKKLAHQITNNEIQLLRAIFQFALYIPEVEMKLKHQAAQGRLVFVKVRSDAPTAAQDLYEKGMACNKLVEYIRMTERLPYNQKIIENHVNRENKRRVSLNNAMRNLPVVNHTTFNTANEIADLGYAVSKNNDGYEYTNPRGGVYKLLFIGRYMSDSDFQRYSGMSKCFGDIQTISLVESVLHSLYDTSRYNHWANMNAAELKAKLDNVFANGIQVLNQREKVDCFIASQIAHLEILLAMLAIFNPSLATVYLEEKRKMYPQVFNPMLPAFGELKVKLQDSRLRLYYESGYSAYYPSKQRDRWHPYKFRSEFYYASGMARRIMEDMYRQNNNMVVNYFKMLQPGMPIYHPEFKTLCDTVNAMTSSNCNPELIQEKIGILRARKA